MLEINSHLLVNTFVNMSFCDRRPGLHTEEATLSDVIQAISLKSRLTGNYVDEPRLNRKS